MCVTCCVACETIEDKGVYGACVWRDAARFGWRVLTVVPECCGFQPRDSFFVGFARIDSFRCKQGAGP